LPGIVGKLLNRSEEEDENPFEAEVVIEYDRSNFASFVGEGGVPVTYPRIFHKWGSTALNPTLPDIRLQYLEENGIKLPPVPARYKVHRDAKLRDGKNAETYLELAEWALGHSLLAEFVNLMGELKQVAPSHPVVKAFDKLQADMDVGVLPDDAAVSWKNRPGNSYKTLRTKHYTILYDSMDSEPSEVKAYAAALEENYRGFYYWFALKGKALPIPNRRLVAVVINKPEEFQAYRQAFDHAPLVADGFYGRRENLAFFSAVRQDDVYNLLLKTTNPIWQSGWSQDDLLKGKGKPGANSADEVVRNQMLALLQKAMSEESIRASVSHVATRQLLVAAGLVAPNMEIPEWLEFGIGSFFETPTGAFWAGIGAPNWKYIVKFKLWKQTEKLDSPEVAIRGVITDEYFLDAAESEKRAPTTKARTMAWALTYFLMSRNLDGMLRFLDELSKLPRDKGLDGSALELAFGRAFDLMDPTDPYRVNPLKLDRLAREWYSFIELTQLESSEAVQDVVKAYQERMNKNKRRPPAANNPGAKPNTPSSPTQPGKPGGGTPPKGPGQ
jgi:hypothetical protein